MTREEEIKKAEVEYFNETYFDGCDYVGEVAKTAAFIAGAKWADEHPKEKMVSLKDVCKFLDEHLYTGTSTGDYDYGQEYVYSDFDNATDLIFALRKAMEE